MNILLNPSSPIAGEIFIPPSKSHTQRVLAFALVNKQKTIIHNLGKSNDELAALKILRDCGSKISETETSIEIQSKGLTKLPKTRVNCNESGLSSRMFTPILANSKNSVFIIGMGSLRKRPMDFFVEVFEELKLDFISNSGKLPFRVAGPLIPKSIELDGSLSSQFITGMIYAYIASPLLKNEKIIIRNPNSLPYIHLSLQVASQFGVDLQFEDNVIQFNGPYKLKETKIFIEGDWSSASFFLVAAAIHGELTIHNLSLNSTQADRAIIHALKQFGAHIEFDGDTIKIQKKDNHAFRFDATHCPDLFPPLVVLAAFANEKSVIKGVKRLFSKESNRALTLEKEFKKLGVRIESIEDEMHIYPIEVLKSNIINPHGDHRIAMATAIMSLKSNIPIVIQDKEVVNKSFPDFFNFLQKISTECFCSIN